MDLATRGNVRGPGSCLTSIPGPYKNEEQARASNGGAYPPDLSPMVKARHCSIDYIFHLLTGYMEPPEGRLSSWFALQSLLPGGAIAMAKRLVDGQVEYEDGTPATETQMAKDVAAFLAWTAGPSTTSASSAACSGCSLSWLAWP